MQRLTVILLTVILGLFSTVTAQPEPVVLGVTAPSWMAWMLDNDDLIQEFEERYPGVSFKFVPTDEEFMTFSPPAHDEEGNYYETMQTYVEAGDVVFVNQWLLGPRGHYRRLFPESTATGRNRP